MSSVVDEDTARAVHTGRETIGAMLSSLQAELQKVFIVFVIGFIGTFYVLRIWIWDFLETTAVRRMDPNVVEATDLITRTPFEVILLQAKIGMIFGIIFAIPALLYLSRERLRRRGVTSAVPISKTYLVALCATSFTLFWAGVIYAYAIFFPYAFMFLGEVAYQSGVKPSWGITEFTEFVALLTISFGLAAQLPLFMGVLAYTEIVPYETFRDKWRHAVVAMTAFGAVFSPPDPFTLIMWAMPLWVLYAFSLGLAKIVANTRRRGQAELGSGTEFMKKRVMQFLGLVAVVFALASYAFYAGAREWIISEVTPQLPGFLAPDEPTTFQVLLTEYGTAGMVGAGFIVAIVVGLLVLLVMTIRVIQQPVYPRESELLLARDPEDVEFDVLEPSDIEERVPREVFEAMDEDQVMELAREAMYDDQREKAQALLDRFDTVQFEAHQAEAAGEGGEGGKVSAAGSGQADDSGGIFASTAAGILDPFTEDETTEEDIGGYAYDLAFIIDSLTSKMMYIVGIFMAVLAGTFIWLYTGGIGDILLVFLERLPDSVIDEVTDGEGLGQDGAEGGEVLESVADLGLVIALHPVEVLIFIVKVSTLAAIVAVLPFVLYWAWPAIEERGLGYADRRIFAVWGGSLFAGFLIGTYLGFFWVAPAVISYLISDAISHQMEISYRIKSFFWLVIYTTVGIGFLFNIVVTMALFHVGGVVHYRTMLARWRPVVVGIFAVAAIVSPRGILTMLLFAIPIALTYLLGLVVLYVLTAGGRLFGGGGGKPSEPDPEPETGAVAE